MKAIKSISRLNTSNVSTAIHSGFLGSSIENGSADHVSLLYGYYSPRNRSGSKYFSGG